MTQRKCATSPTRHSPFAPPLIEGCGQSHSLPRHLACINTGAVILGVSTEGWANQQRVRCINGGWAYQQRGGHINKGAGVSTKGQAYQQEGGRISRGQAYQQAADVYRGHGCIDSGAACGKVTAEPVWMGGAPLALAFVNAWPLPLRPSLCALNLAYEAVFHPHAVSLVYSFCSCMLILCTWYFTCK